MLLHGVISVQINKALSYPIKDRVIEKQLILDADGNPMYHKIPELDAEGAPVIELVLVSHGVLQKRVKLVDAPLTHDVVEPYIDAEDTPDGLHIHVDLDDGRVLDFHIGRGAFEAVNTPEEKQAIIDAEIARLSASATDKLTTWTDGIL